MTCAFKEKNWVESKFKDKVNETIKNIDSNQQLELPGKLKTRTRESGKFLWKTVVLQLGLKKRKDLDSIS